MYTRFLVHSPDDAHWAHLCGGGNEGGRGYARRGAGKDGVGSSTAHRVEQLPSLFTDNVRPSGFMALIPDRAAHPPDPSLSGHLRRPPNHRSSQISIILTPHFLRPIHLSLVSLHSPGSTGVASLEGGAKPCGRKGIE